MESVRSGGVLQATTLRNKSLISRCTRRDWLDMRKRGVFRCLIFEGSNRESGDDIFFDVRAVVSRMLVSNWCIFFSVEVHGLVWKQSRDNNKWKRGEENNMRFIVRTGRGKMLIAAAVFVYTSSLRLLPFRVPAEKHPQGRETSLASAGCYAWSVAATFH